MASWAVEAGQVAVDQAALQGSAALDAGEDQVAADRDVPGHVDHAGQIGEEGPGDTAAVGACRQSDDVAGVEERHVGRADPDPVPASQLDCDVRHNWVSSG
jgi:hypothetical protein